MSLQQLMTMPAVGNYGRFQVLGRLAMGGMAEIFLAREQSQAGAGRLVVLKRILPHVADDPEFVEMFLHEARLAMRVNHPNVCTIYEFGEHAKTYYIAMEYVAGVSITQMHKATFDAGGQGLPAHVSARIAAEVAGALAEAHTATDDEGNPMGLVHRDVTPDNIMLGFDGSVKLLDFGVAKATTQKHRTEAGTLKGKFAYMPPEQYKAEALDGRADIFALGTCLYEAVSGFGLFHRDTEYETMGAILNDEPAPRMREHLPEIDAVLDTIVARSVEKDPDDRYANAGEMQRALEQYLHGHGDVVGRRELSSFVRELCSDTFENGPAVERDVEISKLERRPLSSDIQALLSDSISRDEAEFGEYGRKRSNRVAWLIALVVVGALGTVLYSAVLQGPTRPDQPDRPAVEVTPSSTE